MEMRAPGLLTRVVSIASSERELHAAKVRAVRRYLLGAHPDFVARARVSQSSQAPSSEPLTNVVGIGIGEKVVSNQLTGDRCITFYVRAKESPRNNFPPLSGKAAMSLRPKTGSNCLTSPKYAHAEVSDEDRLPAMIDDIKTDVEEVGTIRPLQQWDSAQRRERLRPAPCGVSVGHVGITAGTIGAMVRDRGVRDNGRRYILSNNHVLANCNKAVVGDAIVQPGPNDDDRLDENRIGNLARFVPIKFDGSENMIDGAVAVVEDGTILNEVCALGIIRGTVGAKRTMVVVKHGRTTGLTRGIITDVSADIRVDYEADGVAVFINTIVVRGVPPTAPFSAGGDSGSVIMDGRGRACGLLFAGSSAADITYANPIQPVLRKLGIRLV